MDVQDADAFWDSLAELVHVADRDALINTLQRHYHGSAVKRLSLMTMSEPMRIAYIHATHDR